MQSIKSKVVIITGASSGIGRATAFEAGKRGARLVLAARNKQQLDEVVAQLNEKGVLAIGVQTDVSLEQDCVILVETALKTYGQIDILINNAGISMRALFQHADLKVIQTVMNVNFWGLVYMTKYALPHVLKSKGSIVGISSIAGYKGLPGRTGYSASKAAMNGFLESLRIENLNKGLHVLTACPGFTSSNIRNTALAADGSMQGESPRDESSMMTAEKVAEHLVRAIEKRKRSLVLTRSGKFTIWMNRLFPGMMDKLVFRHMSKEPNSPF